MIFQPCRALDLNTARPGQKVPVFMLGSAGRYKEQPDAVVPWECLVLGDNLELSICRKDGPRRNARSAGTGPAGLASIELNRDIPAHRLSMPGSSPSRDRGLCRRPGKFGLAFVRSGEKASDHRREDD